jgi:hypothetical protein
MARLLINTDVKCESLKLLSSDISQCNAYVRAVDAKHNMDVCFMYLMY